MPYFRLYEKVKRLNYFNGHIFIVAEVNWDYSHEFTHANWETLEAINGYHNQDIHLWVEKYHPQLNKWLNERNIK